MLDTFARAWRKTSAIKSLRNMRGHEGLKKGFDSLQPPMHQHDSGCLWLSIFSPGGCKENMSHAIKVVPINSAIAQTGQRSIAVL
jgi:hypothetical protein